jgi:hypothetical protein
MSIIKRIIATFSILFSMIGGLINPVDVFENSKDLFSDVSKASYSELYYELSQSKKNETDTWRQGMISGNGLQGVITSGSPYSDTLIYQHMHFIMPNKNV